MRAGIVRVTSGKEKRKCNINVLLSRRCCTSAKFVRKFPRNPLVDLRKKMTRNIPVVFVFLNLILLSLKEVSLTWLQAMVGAPVL